MGLSRLDNFLKSARGTILYVNPNDLDATDSVENKGNSLTRPFKTIQRALIEASRFSYQKGLDNDRFGKTTILLYPGDHIVDNRPGFIPDSRLGSNRYRLRNGATSDNLPPFDLTSNFDLSSPDNELYKLNSVYGGVIVPRGTSLVGLDLRKTKIRPKYVPNPYDANIDRTAIFRVTGECYFWQFSIFDADPNGKAYRDYTTASFVPNYSHHKLTVFEYADGVNNVNINDTFVTGVDGQYDRTDLDMYYEKVGLVYGQSSGRPIEPDYPAAGLDIQPKVDEYRIVGSTGKTVGITEIIAGDGINPDTNITVTTATEVPGLDVDTPFRIANIGVAEYNGQFVVSEKISDTQIKYQVQNAPAAAKPSVAGATLSLTSDTVTSSSPYIFNVSLRSVYGACGLVADGAKATGFRSMVVAQYTGIGLQKDDNAFTVYSSTDGKYSYQSSASEPLSTNSRAVYKPEFANYHIKVINDAFIQAVSVFAIGYAEHFVTESGGDISLTNSNSNFGAKSLSSSGFKKDAFNQDDQGYITHIIPPKELPLTETSVEFELVDVAKTLSVGIATNLYLYGQTNPDVLPENVKEGYRIGARANDTLNVLIAESGVTNEYKAPIVMDGSESTSEKSFGVERILTGNNIANNVIRFTSNHTFKNGESVRVISENGHLPDGIDPNTIYYAITKENASSGITADTDIKLAKTLSDALTDTTGNEIAINQKGGILTVSSRVSDKNSGDIGHPIQFDDANSQWYVNVGSANTSFYTKVEELGTAQLGDATPRTFVTRKNDNRNSVDTLYRARYVIPKDGATARPPSDGYILQESNHTTAATDAEIQTYYGTGSLSSVSQQRNFRFIAGAEWNGSDTVTVATELPHNLTVGSDVQISNVRSTENTTGVADVGFNRNYTVTGISSSKAFNVGLTTNPGTFTNDTSSRTTTLPYFQRKRYENNYYVFRNEEVQQYISGEQDGVYYLTLLNSSNAPTVAPFTNEDFSQPVKELFPQTNRDNPHSDPPEAKSFASPSLIGDVVVNDVRSSITKETINKYNRDVDFGVGISNIKSTSESLHEITTDVDHGLNRITKLSIGVGNSGAGYGDGSGGDYYNVKLVSIGASVTGENATAKVTVDPTGGVTAVKIMDGGSAYGIGNTLAVVGIATTTGHVAAVVEVENIYNNIGDVISVSGIKSESNSAYNQLYRVDSVGFGSATSVNVSSASTIPNFSTTGIIPDITEKAYLYLTGGEIRVSSITFDNISGIATVVTADNHGLRVDTRVRLSGADIPFWNRSFVVTENISLNSFAINVGPGGATPATTGNIAVYHEGYAANDGTISLDNENLFGRMVPTYAGITTIISNNVSNTTTDQLYIENIKKYDIQIGDYLAVDDEIFRVKSTTNAGSTNPVSNPLTVFRGALGSKRATHTINSVVRRIAVNPVELRRHSIIRASGHTFEYVGYGPGNYSTAFPDKQDRQISFQEELLAQSTKKAGGVNFYTGMNDKGISYTGNKKLSTLTGQEEIFDTPVQTVTGEDIGALPSLNVTNATEGAFSRSIRVEGGPDNKASSEFNGPVILNNKLTSISDKGIEAQSYYIQGDQIVSRKHTLSNTSPTLSGNPGDIVWNSDPTDGGYVGWIMSADNDWRRFGNVSNSKDTNIAVYDQVAIGTITPNLNRFQVGGGTTLVSIDDYGVGIGTTGNGYGLHIISGARFSGNITDVDGAAGAPGEVIESTGTGIRWSNIGQINGWSRTADNDGTYNTNQDFIGIGITTPKTNLEVGEVGMAATALKVNGTSEFVGLVTATNVYVSGMLTASAIDLQTGTQGQLSVGVITATGFNVGEFVVTGDKVGIGTTQPKSALDVQGHTTLKTYSENVGSLSINASIVTVDLSQAQSWICTATSDVTKFDLTNLPPGSTSFTIRVDQDGVGSRSVGIDNFSVNGSALIPVRWPGGITPTVTVTANRSDIYSFKVWDGNNAVAEGLYGVIGGQNFA